MRLDLDSGRTARVSALVRELGELLFVLPLFALIAIVVVVPAASGIAHSFTNWSPGYPSPWVGLRNYLDLAHSQTFREILRNEGVFLLGVPLWTLLPVTIALLLHERVPFAGMFRTIFFFPAVLSPAIIGILFRAILRPDGLLNAFLASIGLGALQQSWLDDPSLVKPVLICLLAWAGLGTGVIIFSAALSSVSPELFEAAEMDGASWFQRLRYVMLPGIAPLIALYVVWQIIGVFLFIFGWIYVLTRGGPGFASTTIDYDIYNNAFSFGYYGIAAAESVYLLMTVSLIVCAGWLLQRRQK